MRRSFSLSGPRVVVLASLAALAGELRCSSPDTVLASSTGHGGQGGTGGLGLGGFSQTGDHEICGNGVDDDGDGQIDEGCTCIPNTTQACYRGPRPTRNVGVCKDGVQKCVGGSPEVQVGTWGECTGDTLPGTETCNGKDDDCNGAADESCSCTPGEARPCGEEWTVAPCHPGTQTCGSDGTWGSCAGAQGPYPDKCDGIDNDCNGVVDDGCSDAGPPDAGPCDATSAAPRPLAPVSTGRVTTTKPTLRWELPSGATGAHVTLCHDRACNSVISSLDATGTSVKLTQALNPGIVYWKLERLAADGAGCAPSATWEFFVGKLDTPTDTSWGSVFDINGDGYADVITANCGNDGKPGQADSAFLYVFLGGPSGISSTPSQKITGPADTFGMGWSLSNAGDVNGDGYADALVGTWGSTGGPPGQDQSYSHDEAYVYLGGPAGLSSTPWVTLRGPLANVGDWWNPGNCPAPGSSGCDFFGGVVGPVGDTDGDGYADIGVDIPSPGGTAGNEIYVYRGGASQVSAPVKIGGANLSLMANMYAYYGPLNAADINGDGYSDLIASGSVYMGGPGGVSTTPVVLLPGGTAVTTKASATFVGDIDGDGHADVIILFGADAYVYKGGPSGISTSPTLLAKNVAAQDGYHPAWRFAAIGDFNADGRFDLALGGWGAGPTVSPPAMQSIGLSMGSSSGPAVTPSLFTTTFETPQSGPVVYSAGDINGDGAEDLIVVTTTGMQELTSNMAILYGTPSFGPSVTPTTVTLPKAVACGWKVVLGTTVGGI
jgi:hypothetical protein